MSWLKRGLIALAALLVVAGLALALFVGNLWYGWTVEKLEPAELLDQLRPDMRVFRPEGPGPFPTALLFHGCDGARDGVERWASFFVGEGWAAIIVDSNRPRGLIEREDWQPVCMGLDLWGTERAGDALVALADARTRAFVDPDRIVLAGWSHGGWTVMDLLALDPPPDLPHNLARLPDAYTSERLTGVVGAILGYPYCGFGNRARAEGWSHPAPTLMLLAGADTIVSTEACLQVAAIQETRRQPITVHVYEGVDHGFDQEERAPDSHLVFNPGATEDAFDRARAFLSGLATR